MYYKENLRPWPAAALALVLATTVCLAAEGDADLPAGLEDALGPPKGSLLDIRAPSGVLCMYDMDVRQCVLFKSDTELGDHEALVDYGCCSIIKSRCTRKMQCTFKRECPNIRDCPEESLLDVTRRIKPEDYETMDRDPGRDLADLDLLSQLDDY